MTSDAGASPQPQGAPGAAPLPLLPVVLLVALACALSGAAGVLLAAAPGYASPLYPAAGVGLAAALVYGRAGILGAALGTATVQLALNSGRGLEGAAAVAVPLALGAAAGLQAALGRWLVRRHVAQPLVLAGPGEVLRFLLLGALVASLLGATLATAVLRSSGTLNGGEQALHWWTWWLGDAVGVMLGAPVVLSLVGQPRSDWAPRRPLLALPLLAMTALLWAGWLVVERWNQQHRAERFQQEARHIADSLAMGLEGPLRALQAVQNLQQADPDPHTGDWQRFTAWWLGQPLHLQALGWAERVRREGIARLEAGAHADGLANYRVFDGQNSAAAATAASPAASASQTAWLLPIRLIEPLAPNAAVLGLNTYAWADAATALALAEASGEMRASAAFAAPAGAGDGLLVGLYQPVYQGQPQDATQRQAALRGAVFAWLRVEQAAAALVGRSANPWNWCLVDLVGSTPPRRLAGAAGCEAGVAAPFHFSRELLVGGRRWELRLDALPGQVPAAPHGNALAFALVGLLSVGLLGALLLIVTGRARRVEYAVNERTLALQHEATERQRTADALRESEQRLRAIFATARVGIVSVDPQGRILQCNPAFGQLLGYSSEALLQRDMDELTHPDDREARAEAFRAMLDGQAEFHRSERRMLRSDGSVLQAQVDAALLRDPEGRPYCTVAVVEDIGERLRLAEAERERDAAEAASQAKTEFVSRMSHELRTPLNAMLGFSQLLGLDNKPRLAEHQQVWASQIQQAGWHLLQMINDTLDLSRIESGMLKVEPVPVEVEPLLHSALALVEDAAAKRGLHTDCEVERRARAVMGDETRVRQILTNLLSNAVKYNVEGGAIHVSATATDSAGIDIAIRDTGLGMSPQQMEGLFQPYNRLGRESSGVEGTGIGLVISRKLAELMGGALRAISSAGVGSTFTLTLPRATFLDSGLSANDEDALDDPQYRRRLVLYVEDNDTNVEVMRGILLRRPQVQLQVAMNGLDALAAIRQQRPSLVLMDMHLPDIDGLELLRHLKQDPELAAIPVVVVSADATNSRVEEAMAQGAAHYLTKPVNLSAFLSTLDSILEELDTYYG